MFKLGSDFVPTRTILEGSSLAEQGPSQESRNETAAGLEKRTSLKIVCLSEKTYLIRLRVLLLMFLCSICTWRLQILLIGQYQLLISEATCTGGGVREAGLGGTLHRNHGKMIADRGSSVSAEDTELEELLLKCRENFFQIKC